MVHPQPRAFVVAASKGEIPIGIDALLSMEGPQRVGPAGFQHQLIGGAALREVDGIINPPLWGNGVDVRWNHIVVTTQNNGRIARGQRVRVVTETFEPAHLVVKLRTRGRIAIWQIETSDDYAIDLSLKVSAMGVIGIARQAAATFRQLPDARKDRDAVVRFLAVPDRLVPGLVDRLRWKLLIGRLELLQACNSRPIFHEPPQ